MKLHLTSFFAAFAFCAAVLTAQEAADTAKPEAAPTLDEMEAGVNAIAETLNRKVERFNVVRMKLAQAPNDPEFTSDTVEAKRKELKELQNAIVKAQIELREEVNKLPAVKALAAETETLNGEIQKLREQKDADMYKLRRARLDETAAQAAEVTRIFCPS